MPARWRTRRRSRGPSRGREYWRRRRTGIALHRPAQWRRSTRVRRRPRFPPQPAPRRYCRWDAPVPLTDKCRCSRNSGYNSRWRTLSSPAELCGQCRGLSLRVWPKKPALRFRPRGRSRANQAPAALLRARLPGKDPQTEMTKRNWQVDEQALFSWEKLRSQSADEWRASKSGDSARFARCVLEFLPGDRSVCPRTKERAQSFRERISIWGRLCLASCAGAHRTVESSAFHPEARVKLLRRAAATIDRRHRLVLGDRAARARHSVLPTLLARARLERGQTVAALVLGRPNEHRSQPAR